MTGVRYTSSLAIDVRLIDQKLSSQYRREIGPNQSNSVEQNIDDKGQKAITPTGTDVSAPNASSSGCESHAAATAIQIRARVEATGHRCQAATVATNTAPPMLWVSML